MQNNKNIWIGIIVIIILIIGGTFYYWHYDTNKTVTVGTTANPDAVQNCLQKSGTEKDSCFRALVEQTKDSSLCSNFSSPKKQQDCQNFINSSLSENGTSSGDFTGQPPVSGTLPPIQPPPPATGTAILQRDLAYGSIDPHQKVDVYSNTAFQNAPVILIVHGGSWVEGDKNGEVQVALNFTKYGYVAVPINYRLANTHGTGANGFPTGINDVACSVVWTKNNIAKYGGDPNKIILWGNSAGTNLAGMVAYDSEGNWLSDCSSQNQNLKVAGYIGFSGTYNFPLINRVRWQVGCYLQDLLGLSSCGQGQFQWASQDPAKLKEASPITYVSAGDPPAVVVGGDNDCYVNYVDKSTGKCDAVSVTFADALSKVGLLNNLTIIPGAVHSDIKAGFESNPSSYSEVWNFLSTFK